MRHTRAANELACDALRSCRLCVIFVLLFLLVLVLILLLLLLLVCAAVVLAGQ